MLRAIMAAALLALTATTYAWAAQPPAKPAAAQTPEQQAAAFEAGLMKRGPTAELKDANVFINLGDDYYFLDAADSRKVLVDAWGNPPDAAEGVLGMIFPKGASPLAEGGWGAVLSYEDTGFVSDKDARKTDYDKVLAEMRKHEDEDNQQRSKAGLHTAHLVGWAQPPVYDPARHSLIWARDLKFSGSPHDTVNYDVRVLGRRGVLSMNIVAAMDNLQKVKPAGEALQQVAHFNNGARYSDFNPKTDHKAAYGLAGLILAGAGIVAAKKIGILAVGLLFFKKAAVLILAAGAAVFGWLKKVFGGKDKGGGKGPGGAASGDAGKSAGPWASHGSGDGTDIVS